MRPAAWEVIHKENVAAIVLIKRTCALQYQRLYHTTTYIISHFRGKGLALTTEREAVGSEDLLINELSNAGSCWSVVDLPKLCPTFGLDGISLLPFEMRRPSSPYSETVTFRDGMR